MHTLGYRFRPWTEERSLVDGGSILRYVRETARETGIDTKIRFDHRVLSARWSSAESRWTVEAERTDSGQKVRMTCGFLQICSGYYRYDEGYFPDFPGVERYRGPLIHPQQWPEGLDYEGKRIVVIGSGATAVTLVPAMADKAAHVTMLQRSPSYVVSLPAEDRLAVLLRKVLPDRKAFALVRWKNILLQMLSYQLSRRRPELMKRLIRNSLVKALPPDYEVDTHFNPAYEPWDQRLCLVPDGDLFDAIERGKAEIVTDRIRTFTEKGIELESGRELEADIVVSATGLNLLFLGGMSLEVDGTPADLPSKMTYKGMMLNDVPNMAFTLGYSNASWTLKADLTAEYVCRLLNHMDTHGYSTCVPRINDPSIVPERVMALTSGYVERSLHELPKQGSKEPWRLRQNYPIDLRALRRGPLEDGAMEFSSPVRETQPAEPALA
jgi:cation diffusion facilitator CzcD-associated flavoprotein CzcO